jgi:ankyrin repeat protein
MHLWLQYGDTPLFLAAAIRHDEIVGLLVRANADVNAADKVWFVSLLVPTCALPCDLLNINMDSLSIGTHTVHAWLQNGCTSLHWASRDGHTKIVEMLVQAKANVNAADKVRVFWGGALNPRTWVQLWVSA